MRLTKALFWISDICAWVLLCLALFFAFVIAAVGPVAGAMDHVPVSWPRTIVTIVACLLISQGAFLLTRRRPLGLLLVLIPTVMALIQGGFVFAVGYLALVVLVFFLPFMLVFFEFRGQAVREETSLESDERVV